MSPDEGIEGRLRRNAEFVAVWRERVRAMDRKELEYTLIRRLLEKHIDRAEIERLRAIVAIHESPFEP